MEMEIGNLTPITRQLENAVLAGVFVRLKTLFNFWRMENVLWMSMFGNRISVA